MLFHELENVAKLFSILILVFDDTEIVQKVLRNYLIVLQIGR